MSGLTREQRVAGVHALLGPSNIAIVGASDRPGSWSGGVWRALRRSGFAGKVYPVNPRNATVWDGETCYRSLRDLPELPDPVVVLVPGAAAAETITKAAKSRAPIATVFSSPIRARGGLNHPAPRGDFRPPISFAGTARPG